MGCTGSKAISNRVVPIATNPDDKVASKGAWGDVPSKNHDDITDEERSNNTTPPRTAGENEASPIDQEGARTPEDVSTVTPVSLDNLLEEAAALFPETPKDSAGRPLQHLGDHSASSEAGRSPAPAKQEVHNTTTGVRGNEVDCLPLPKQEEGEAAIPHWERQEPLPARPGTSSRRPENAAGRLVVYKTSAQKKAEEQARRKRVECENESIAAGVVARPGTANRKQSALPPLEERRRAKAQMPAPIALPCDAVEVSTFGGCSFHFDESEFVPPPSSPVKKPKARPVSQKADVFNLDDEEAEACDLEEETL